MRLPKFRYTVLAGAITGLGIPLLIYTLQWLNIVGAAGRWLLSVWPGAIMLDYDLGDSPGDNATDFVILMLSVACNMLLYVILFTFVWSLGRVFRAWRASLNDGTTI